jgi:hypothetical protein
LVERLARRPTPAGFFLEPEMFATTALATCKERTLIDWIGAVTADLLTIAWIGVLIFWWLG